MNTRVLPSILKALCVSLCLLVSGGCRSEPSSDALRDAGSLVIRIPRGDGEEQARSLAKLADQNAPTPEHERLGWLVGDWEMTGEWSPLANNSPLAISGRFENRWILFGHAVESNSWSPEGELRSKVLYGFDSQTDEYFAFSVTAVANHYALTRGHYDPATRTLVLKGIELHPHTGQEIPYTRNVILNSERDHAVVLTFPDGEGGSRSHMALRFKRTN